MVQYLSLATTLLTGKFFLVYESWHVVIVSKDREQENEIYLGYRVSIIRNHYQLFY